MKKTTIILSLSAVLAASLTVQADEKRFKRWDTDGDGKVTSAEYIEISKNKEKAAKRFKKYDADGDGYISKAEEVKFPTSKKK